MPDKRPMDYNTPGDKSSGVKKGKKAHAGLDGPTRIPRRRSSSSLDAPSELARRAHVGLDRGDHHLTGGLRGRSGPRRQDTAAGRAARRQNTTTTTRTTTPTRSTTKTTVKRANKGMSAGRSQGKGASGYTR